MKYDNLNYFFQMEDDHKYFFQMEDDLNSFKWQTTSKKNNGTKKNENLKQWLWHCSG